MRLVLFLPGVIGVRLSVQIWWEGETFANDAYLFSLRWASSVQRLGADSHVEACLGPVLRLLPLDCITIPQESRNMPLRVECNFPISSSLFFSWLHTH